MILVRQVFQIKYGHMDEVLAVVKQAAPSSQGPAGITRVLTDISGNHFTLVLESKAESLDAYWNALQALFQDPEQGAQAAPMAEYFVSGHREFYTVEYEAGNPA